MQIKREKISTLWREVFPLLVEHFKEISANQDIPLQPNIRMYNKLEKMGMFRAYVARIDGELVGYAAYIVNPNMHYQQSLQAVQDVLFLRKEYRKGFAGIRLIKYADEQLLSEGVQIVYHHVKVANDFGPVLERLGYRWIEKIYSKRLDKG